MVMRVSRIGFLSALCAILFSTALAVAEDKVLFDFNDESAVKAFTNVNVYALRKVEAEAEKAAYDAKVKAATNPATVKAYVPQPSMPSEPEPAIKIEQSAPDSDGKRGMKLTFAGGHFPTVGAKLPQESWFSFKAFHADVIAERDCIVVFRAVKEGGNHLTLGWDNTTGRWEFAARCSAGKNNLVAPNPKDSNTLWKNVTGLEVYIYDCKAGDSITIGKIYLSNQKPEATSSYNEVPQLPKDGFKVAGTDLVVKDANDLGDRLKLKDNWVKPELQTVEQLEADIQAQYAKIKKDHPKAVLAMLRQGQKGYDPANPDKEFTGWESGYGYIHLPMALTLIVSGTSSGKVEKCEACLRGRPLYCRVNLASIPNGAEILAAQLIMVNATKDADAHWETGPTLVVTEPCNRPWKEYEVTGFEYAKGKLWKDFCAQSWGEDGDCAAVYLSYGPGNGKAMAWDFTHAIRYWMDGKHPNYGFLISSASHYFHRCDVFTYRCKDLVNRPCVAVIYEPKP